MYVYTYVRIYICTYIYIYVNIYIYIYTLTLNPKPAVPEMPQVTIHVVEHTTGDRPGVLHPCRVCTLPGRQLEDAFQDDW